MNNLTNALKKWRVLSSSTTNNTINSSYRNGILTTSKTTPSDITTGSIGTTSSTTGPWSKWTKEEKATLAKVGFKYNKGTKCWELNLSTTVFVQELEEILAWSSDKEYDKPSDMAINTMKQLKKQLIEKLTAKIILMELIKPHKVKEDD